MTALNDIQILSNGFAATINGKTTMKGGNIKIHGGTGFNLTVPSYYSDKPTSVRLTNYIRKEVGPLNDGWEIQPYITTGSLTATYGITIGGVRIGSYPELWTSSGAFMGGDQRATLSKNVSDMPNGIVLVWSAYSTKVEDYCWNYTFIPKEHVENRNGGGVSVFLAGSASFKYVALKYIYVWDNEVLGTSLNTTNATIGGIQSTPQKFVLRKIIGV